MIEVYRSKGTVVREGSSIACLELLLAQLGMSGLLGDEECRDRWMADLPAAEHVVLDALRS